MFLKIHLRKQETYWLHNSCYLRIYSIYVTENSPEKTRNLLTTQQLSYLRMLFNICYQKFSWWTHMLSTIDTWEWSDQNKSGKIIFIKFREPLMWRWPYPEKNKNLANQKSGIPDKCGRFSSMNSVKWTWLYTVTTKTYLCYYCCYQKSGIPYKSGRFSSMNSVKWTWLYTVPTKTYLCNYCYQKSGIPDKSGRFSSMNSVKWTWLYTAIIENLEFLINLEDSHLCCSLLLRWPTNLLFWVLNLFLQDLYVFLTLVDAGLRQRELPLVRDQLLGELVDHILAVLHLLLRLWTLLVQFFQLFLQGLHLLPWLRLLLNN